MNKLFVLNLPILYGKRLCTFVVTLILALTPMVVMLPVYVAAETIDSSPETTSIDTTTGNASEPNTSTSTTDGGAIPPSSGSSSQIESNTIGLNSELTTPIPEQSQLADITPTPPSTTSDSSTPVDSTLSVAVQNETTENASTGDISLQSNESAGNIASGAATSSSTNINIIQSDISTSGSASGPVLFSYDINGTVNGNLLVTTNDLLGDPSSDSIALSSDTPILLIDNVNVSVVNNVELSATTGNINALSNETLGDVTSGDAYAVANIINLISSGISSGQSFIGVINIHGSLNGDIILPAGLLTTNATDNQGILLGTASTNQSFIISNLVTSQATSGGITAVKNGSLGDITTGNASNSTTTTNIIGSSTTADNYILVFVNVLGTWKGMLLQLPAGQTTYAPTIASAAIPNGGDAQTEVYSSSTISLFNTVSVVAQSGNIVLNSNQKVGDVQTGNAVTKVNIVNIANSHVSLSGWFGILLINVFGDWTGSLLEEPKPQNDTNQPADATAVLAIVASSNNIVQTDQNAGIYKTKRYFIPVGTTYQNDATPPTNPVVDIDSFSTPASASTLLVEPKDNPSDETPNAWALFALIAGVTSAVGAVIGTRYYLHR